MVRGTQVTNRAKSAGNEIARLLPKGAVLFGEPLSKHTSFRIGGPCDYFALPDTEEELANLLGFVRQSGLPYYLMGNGTNLLCADEGFAGVVIQTARLNRIMAEDGGVYAECGASLTRAAYEAAAASLTGLEFAHGIPGSVGGGTVMNAGAYGGEIADAACEVFYLDPAGNRFRVQAKAAGFAYRSSRFQREALTVTAVRFKLREGRQTEIREKMADYAERRRTKQPLDLPSAGSVFKRPANGYASALIDACGLKGCRIGGACVSKKHAGFIVNTGGATCRDVLALIEYVREQVLKQSGVLLECEIKTLGV